MDYDTDQKTPIIRNSSKKPAIPADWLAITLGKHHDPFTILGFHQQHEQGFVRIYSPQTQAMEVSTLQGPMRLERIADSDFFQWSGPKTALPRYYTLTWYYATGASHTAHDPYSFLPVIPTSDLHLFNGGNHTQAYSILGANPMEIDGISGVLFATWAPNAQRVSVVGDFNQWDGRRHPMRVRGDSGVWELFIPGLRPKTLYKFEILNRTHGHLRLKADPYAKYSELRPNTASVVCGNHYDWHDQEWLQQRAQQPWLHAPMSIYEVHLGSWRRGPNGEFLSYRELARQLVAYVKELGFTHIELLPVTEHPFDASWGYQTTGYFAVTSRFGDPDDFKYFVDYCHQHHLGVILDWAPAHFPKDDFALAQYDGTALYEHADPRKGEHRDWGTLIFNYGRNEVKSFLISSASLWLREYHVDGLRVDAVASMLYLDYSRQAGDWIPNEFGGRENLEAIAFIRQLNVVCHEQFPGALIFAEESTDWTMVSRPTYLGGLGFSMKWNMGWMHDTLQYFSLDSIYRHYHHNMLTFSLLYAFTENFMLPFSHDEVVHGKASLLNKMPGDEWQKFANLRLLYTYMFSHPGKKLLFMGNELAHGQEWRFDQSLDWYLLDYEHHRGIQRLIKDLNHLYSREKALHKYDFEGQGFEWIDCHDAAQSVLSFIRKADQEYLVVVCNFTPVPRLQYRIGVPDNGRYEEIFNSDSHFYWGSNTGNGQIDAENKSWMGRSYSLALTLPPLGAIILRPLAK